MGTMKRVCYEAGCGKNMLGKRQNYSYRECGLPSVTLLNIMVYQCVCGAIVPEIPSPGVLHNAIAMSVLKKNSLLSGDEIRFVRKVAGYSATEFSRVMGVQKSTISHWETERKRIGKESDRLVRLICFARMVERITGSKDEFAENMAGVARMVKSLNLTSVLEHIQNKSEGSAQVTINPDMEAGIDFSNAVLALQ